MSGQNFINFYINRLKRPVNRHLSDFFNNFGYQYAGFYVKILGIASLSFT